MASPQRSDPEALLIQLNELDSYADSELVRKKIASFLAGFIVKPCSDSSIIGEEIQGEASVVELAAGRINVLERVRGSPDQRVLRYRDKRSVADHSYEFLILLRLSILKNY